ncbi:Aste57867_793 [Aphanomyces stellatus]|uniref:Aste57867_793 protein n=1 Tax=Aphanomyces stellatus TaxID=120398 RepID=A0A485K4Q1_9STRA|nr:hypothetical protein As57867_000792 [Aphanomyces stellatus]VFT78017.1 Aste57867_793 [Aphanomyces stellatus]
MTDLSIQAQLATQSTTPVLGLTLRFFKHFVELHGGRDVFQDVTTTAMCKDFVKPFTRAHELSLVEHVRQHVVDGDQYVKPATWFASHAWSYKFLDVVDALTDFFNDQGLDSDNVAVWFCMFNNNQHLVKGTVIPFEFWVDSFQSALKAIGNVVMVLSPWNNPTTLTRTWCVFEIYVAVSINARFEVAMGKSQKQAFLQDILVNKVNESVSVMLSTINSEQSSTTISSDRDNIAKRMQSANISFADLDRMLFDVLENWIIRTVQSQIDNTTLVEKASWLYAMGGVFHDKLSLDKAKACLDAAIHIYRHELHDQHPSTWRALMQAANITKDMGETQDVWEPMFQEALDRQIALLGKDHFDTLLTMYEFGYAYDRTSTCERGLTLLQECFERSDRLYGDTKSLTLDALHGMGRWYFLQSQLHQAETIFRACLERRRAALGDNHMNTQSSLSHLSEVYQKQGKYRLALDLASQVFVWYRRVNGPKHEFTWIAHHNVGRLHMLLGDYAEAERIVFECLDASTRLDQTPGRRWHSRCTMGRLCLSTDRGDEGLEHLVVAHNGFKKLHSPVHVHARIALYWLCLNVYAINGLRTTCDVDKLANELLDAGCDDDTWAVFACHGCFLPIRGSLYTCLKCPKYSQQFCWMCILQSQRTALCTHPQSSWEKYKPPARYLQEKRLELLAQEANWSEYANQFQAYVNYCTKYTVPDDEWLAPIGSRVENVARVRRFQLWSLAVLAMVVMCRQPAT